MDNRGLDELFGPGFKKHLETQPESLLNRIKGLEMENQRLTARVNKLNTTLTSFFTDYYALRAKVYGKS